MRKPTTGRFETREELVAFIWNRYENTNQNITQIAKVARISAVTVSKILSKSNTQGSNTMATFTTKLKLGGKGYGVSGNLDPYIEELTVGEIRVTETHPSHACERNPCYEEEYMCFETGIGSGTLWKYGKSIFATREEAEKGVIAVKQKNAIEIARRDACRAEEAARVIAQELETLERLTKKYGNA